MHVLIRAVVTAVALAVATWLLPGIHLGPGSTLPFHITGFWPAFWGAIIVGIVGWLLGVLIPERDGQPSA